MTYRWTEESRAVAERFDFVARAVEIAGRDLQLAVLLVSAARDEAEFREPPVALRDALLSALAALVERLLGEVLTRAGRLA